MSGILNGIRVIDLARYIAGPYCGQLLADLGAEVIKVEKPGTGEVTRTLGPYSPEGVAMGYCCYNRNKKSITVDTRKEEGRQILRELIAKSDVLLENFRTGTMEMMGLGWDEVQKINPRIIMVSVSGFGSTGPFKDRLAFDGVISALSGVTRIGKDHPERSQGAIHDTMAAMYATIATLSALYERNTTGKGQFLDVAMIASSTLLRNDVIANAAVNVDSHVEGAGDDETPYGFLKAKDGWFYFHAGLGDMYSRLLTIIDDPYLHEERFKTSKGRAPHYDEMMAHIQAFANDYTAKELEDIFTKAGVTAAVLSTPKDLLHNEHLNQAGWMMQLPMHGREEPVPMVGLPWKSSEHTWEYKAAPALGENNDEIFHDVLGYSDEHLAELHGKGIV